MVISPRIYVILLLILATLWPRSLAYAQTSPQSSQATQAPTIDKNTILIILRSTISAINQANATNNYTVLRELGCPSFQTANSSGHLSDLFAPLRSQHMDLSGVSVIDPQLTGPPTITQNGILHIIGFFPSAPIQIHFDFIFAPVNGRYCAEGLSISLDRPASPIGVNITPETQSPSKDRKPAPSDPTSKIKR